jgi:hypothetical protein
MFLCGFMAFQFSLHPLASPISISIFDLHFFFLSSRRSRHQQQIPGSFLSPFFSTLLSTPHLSPPPLLISNPRLSSSAITTPTVHRHEGPRDWSFKGFRFRRTYSPFSRPSFPFRTIRCSIPRPPIHHVCFPTFASSLLLSFFLFCHPLHPIIAQSLTTFLNSSLPIFPDLRQPS